VQQWKKKPEDLQVQAQKITKENVAELAAWCGGYPISSTDAITGAPTEVGINVPGLEGSVRATEGQYLVKNENTGRFYARNAREFEQQFELWAL
jgi:hypothetical protein